MFKFFQKKDKQYFAEALINKAIEMQSEFYHLLKHEKIFNLDDSNIDRLEITYFSSSIIGYLYFRFGKNQYKDKSDIIDSTSELIIKKCLNFSKNKISYKEAILEYRDRWTAYGDLMNMVFEPSKSTSGNPSITLLMIAFQNITKLSAKGNMVMLSASSKLLNDLITENIEFIKDKL